jgi:transcriptional regulator of acetoin/glycerol metabolism
MRLTFKRAERGFKRRYFMRALIVAQGRVTDAAQLAGVNRTHFYNTMRALGIDGSRIPHRDVYSLKPYTEAHREFCRRNIRRILIRANWSPVEASRLSGINRTHFYRLAEKLGIEWPRVLELQKGNAAWRALDARPPRQPREVSRPRPSP